MRTSAIAWLLLGIVAAMPFFAWAHLEPAPAGGPRIFATWVDALFEGMSGITSTGLTVVTDPGALPRSLQLWWTLLEWLGGVGVVVLALAFADFANAPGDLYMAEARSRRFGDSLRSRTTTRNSPLTRA